MSTASRARLLELLDRQNPDENEELVSPVHSSSLPPLKSEASRVKKKKHRPVPILPPGRHSVLHTSLVLNGTPMTPAAVQARLREMGLDFNTHDVDCILALAAETLTPRPDSGQSLRRAQSLRSAPSSPARSPPSSLSISFGASSTPATPSSLPDCLSVADSMALVHVMMLRKDGRRLMTTVMPKPGPQLHVYGNDTGKRRRWAVLEHVCGEVFVCDPGPAKREEHWSDEPADLSVAQSAGMHEHIQATVVTHANPPCVLVYRGRRPTGTATSLADSSILLRITPEMETGRFSFYRTMPGRGPLLVASLASTDTKLRPEWLELTMAADGDPVFLLSLCVAVLWIWL
eukprot:GGOE01055408.1.p1 GENE.GGOE01055408.1~~GGOE01055408.1.p1  ORF type:complete len:355 (-),score=66.82 GGOE01055408.1:276-1313(-)